MNGPEFLIGSGNILSTPLPAFSGAAVEFSAAISEALMREPEAERYPDVAAFGRWARRDNVESLPSRPADDDDRVGRGLAFHIPPSEIPVCFAYSYLWGVLAGCANVVRLPSIRTPQADLLTGVIAAALPMHPEIRSRTAFVRYPSGDGTTRVISATADARVIWGSDETIAAIRAMPARPRCVDICLSDRYSVCLLDCAAVAAASEEELGRLAREFYADTYAIDQDACSSPRLVLWLGDDAGARERFWRAETLAAEGYEMPMTAAMDKYAQVCEDAIIHPEVSRASMHAGGLIYREELSRVPIDVTVLRGRCGSFYERSIRSFADLCAMVNDRFQTVTYYGVDPIELRRELITRRARGVDRIVPVGSALDLSPTWDGHDVITTLGRAIEVKVS